MIALLVTTALAAAPPLKTYDFGDRKVEFIVEPGTEDLYSRSCAAPKRCLARNAIQSATMAGIKVRHGDIPTATEELCRKSGGRVVIGYSAKKSEHGFCTYADDTLVSLGSLYAAAMRNAPRR